jgi:hypothetical protein
MGGPTALMFASGAMNHTTFLVTTLAALSLPASAAVTIDWVSIGDSGNAADRTGYGAVAYDYQIGK